MTCDETAELMSDHAEGNLRGFRRWRVARHLARCERCRSVWQSLLVTIESLRALGKQEPAPNPKIADAVVERIAAAR